MIPSEVLLQGYRLGVFPMAMEDGEIGWFSPDPRAILPLKEFHVPQTLERIARKKTFEIRIDTSFVEVMRQCAQRPETWINDEIIESYTRLHQLGHAHSDRGLARREARRRPLRRLHRRRLLRRIDVSPRPRRLEDRVARARRTSARAEVRPSRHPMAHAPSPKIRRHRNPARRNISIFSTPP